MIRSRYVQLTFFRTYAELKSESTKTYLGLLWWVLDPIIYMSIFYVVFAVLLERRTADFVAFLLVGLVAWQFFANTLNNCALSIQSGRELMQQVAFPKIIFPLSVFLSNLFKYVIVLILLFLFLWWRGYSPSAAYWWLPLVFLIHLGLALGAGLVAAALVPLAPDLRHLVTHGVQLLFFLSGIFYSPTDIPVEKRDLLYLNPMVSTIESYRNILLQSTEPDFVHLRSVLLVAAGLLLLGYFLLARFDRTYPTITKIA